MTKMHELAQIGQAIWLDYIRRDMLNNGKLAELLSKGLRGMTSNPAIFAKAISGSDNYNAQIIEMGSAPVQEVYETLAITDIKAAADMLRPVYEESSGVDGYISLEANPHLAFDEQGTVEEVRRLREMVNRDNVMYKIPATPEGIRAVRTLIGEGVSINITLMFNMTHYEDVAEAYISGLEDYAAKGGDLSKVASVASFFVSRVDAKIDALLADKGANDLLGKIAIANSKAVYARFGELFSSDRWQALADKGARVQRPLWASTSTKNPDYPDTLYVDTLIGADTVNTLPPATLDAFLDHGTVAVTVTEDMETVRTQLAKLADLGIDLLAVGEELQREGVDKFVQPFDELLATIEQKREQVAGD